jgi:hypothetical protein
MYVNNTVILNKKKYNFEQLFHFNDNINKYVIIINKNTKKDLYKKNFQEKSRCFCNCIKSKAKTGS